MSTDGSADVAATPEPVAGGQPSGAAPELRFSVLGCEPLAHAAVPTLRFSLGIDAQGAHVRSIMLEAQIRIAAAQRGYDDAEQAQLRDLFGAPRQWPETVRGLLWTHATAIVTPFEGATVADLLVPCTYDFEVAASKYLAGVRDGAVPLELLFSGTVFYVAAGGALQISRISWDAQATHRLPVAVWREAIERHFPDSAWLRVRRETFERLVAFRGARALTSWDAVLDALLHDRERP